MEQNNSELLKHGTKRPDETKEQINDWSDIMERTKARTKLWNETNMHGIIIPKKLRNKPTYCAACRVEYRPLNPSNSQLPYFQQYFKMMERKKPTKPRNDYTMDDKTERAEKRTKLWNENKTKEIMEQSKRPEAFEVKKVQNTECRKNARKHE